MRSGVMRMMVAIGLIFHHHLTMLTSTPGHIRGKSACFVIPGVAPRVATVRRCLRHGVVVLSCCRLLGAARLGRDIARATGQSPLCHSRCRPKISPEGGQHWAYRPRQSRFIGAAYQKDTESSRSGRWLCPCPDQGC